MHRSTGCRSFALAIVLVAGCGDDEPGIETIGDSEVSGDSGGDSTSTGSTTGLVDSTSGSPDGDSSTTAPPDPPCMPTSCEQEGAECGTVLQPGCDADLECGECDPALACGAPGIPNTCVLPTTACVLDRVEGLPVEGIITTNVLGDIVPLCDGEVLIADRAVNRVDLFDVSTETIGVGAQLSAAPGRMALDPGDSMLYVAMSPAAVLGRVEIGSMQVTEIALDAGSVGIAIGQGLVFVVQDDVSTWPDQPLSLLDARSGAVLQTWVGTYEQLIVYDPFGQHLVSARTDSSPAGLRRYSFDPVGLTLMEEQYLHGSGGNCAELSLSPDASRFALSCGGGNGKGYSVYDWSIDDFAVLGEFFTDAYPRAARWSTDGTRFVATNGNEVFVFDATTHALVESWAPIFEGCGFVTIEHVAFSRGGRVVYAYTSCETSGRLAWYVL